MLSDSILEVDSVQKSFGHKSILSGVFLQCRSGEIIGLLGRNGCGKSTLLKIIFGIVEADYKFVRIDGQVKSKTSELLREISYLDQQNFIPKNFSVSKAIRLSIDIKAIESFRSDPFIMPLLSKKIHQLSGGELRYFEIKLVLSNNSKFALLDEPYNGLSPLMVSKVQTMISENSSRKGIIVTDHSYRNILGVATRLILLKDGKTHQIKSHDELVTLGYLKSDMI